MIDLNALVTAPDDPWRISEPGRLRLGRTSIVIDLDITKYASFRLRWIDPEHKLVAVYGGECQNLVEAKKKGVELYKLLDLMGHAP